MPDVSEWLRMDRAEFMSRWYSEHYQGLSYRGSVGRVQSWMHRSLERGYSERTTFGSVLEVGGNVGEHVRFVRHAFDHYTLSDLTDGLTEQRRKELLEEGVIFEIADVQHLPWPDYHFDRVVNTCVLHHVPDSEQAMLEMRRVLVPDGTADVFLPSDPGLLFRLSRQIGPVRAAARQGLQDVKQLVDARDHRNHVGGLLRIAKHVFRNDEVTKRTYPVPGMTWNSSLWITLRIRKSS